MTPCRHYQMRRKLALIGDIYTKKESVRNMLKVKLRRENGAN